MNYKKLVIESGIKMLDEGYTLETWGNISIRDPETGWIYLTPSGMKYHEICEDDVVVCDINGTVLEGRRKPTVEKELHLAVLRSRPEANAVVHTHPLYSTVFACTGETIPLLIDEAAKILGDEIKTAAYALPGSGQLVENCIAALGQKANACLLMSHGAVHIGTTIDAAFTAAKVLELTAQIYQMIRAMGARHIPISPENISAIQEFSKNKYGQGSK